MSTHKLYHYSVERTESVKYLKLKLCHIQDIAPINKQKILESSSSSSR